jgi:hypothetical protein
MAGSDLQFWANIAQIVSLPVAILALALQVMTWLVPEPFSSGFLSLIHKARPILSYIVVVATSFWLGSRYFSSVPPSSASLHLIDFFLILGAIVIILLMIFTGSIPNEPISMIQVQRRALIDTGVRLIHMAKNKVIMFGSDMSWAGDYEESIRFLTSHGKEVIVLYAISQATGVLRNVEILKTAGANLISVPSDSGIRGMLIDPNDHDDALLYTAYRRLKPSATIVKEGEKSSEQNYEYYARIYDVKHDWLIIRAITKYSEALQYKRI